MPLRSPGLRLVVIAGAALLIAAAPAKPLWEPPTVASSRLTSHDLVPTGGSGDIVGAVRIGNVPVVLEETPLRDLQSRLGGVIADRGDAGNYLTWLCLHQPAGPSRWAIWLEGGELTNGKKVSGFQWRRVSAAAAFDRRCEVLPATSNMELPVDIRLGQTRAQVLATLGRPTADHGTVLVYLRTRTVDIRGTPFSATNRVTIAFHGGTVQTIEVWKATAD